MESQAEEVKRLKAMRDELDGLKKEEFLSIVRQKYGDNMANMVMHGGFDDFARSLIKASLDEQINELGG